MDKMKRYGICVAGTLIADEFHRVDSYPSEGMLATVRETDTHVGGSGNLIIDLARLDASLPIKVCAVVGEDDSGERLLKALGSYPNIDTGDVVREGESSVTLVFNAADSKQRTFFYIPGASDVFDASSIRWENINSAVFHLEYLLLMKRVDAPDPEYGTHGARILKTAREHGMLTSIDMFSEISDRLKSVVLPALRFTDVCCINEVEAEAVTGVKLPKDGAVSEEWAREALSELCRLGVSDWAVIHSPRISYGLDREAEKFFTVESLKLPEGYVKGTTGAGDAFCSGILYGLQARWSLGEAMRLAVAAAACSLSEDNGTDGMRSADEAMRLWELY